ncbi:hypothetical protein ABNF97_30445 [Plantactinospora sp. B6F1]
MEVGAIGLISMIVLAVGGLCCLALVAVLVVVLLATRNNGRP